MSTRGKKSGWAISLQRQGDTPQNGFTQDSLSGGSIINIVPTKPTNTSKQSRSNIPSDKSVYGSDSRARVSSLSRAGQEISNTSSNPKRTNTHIHTTSTSKSSKPAVGGFKNSSGSDDSHLTSHKLVSDGVVRFSVKKNLQIAMPSLSVTFDPVSNSSDGSTTPTHTHTHTHNNNHNNNNTSKNKQRSQQPRESGSADNSMYNLELLNTAHQKAQEQRLFVQSSPWLEKGNGCAPMIDLGKNQKPNNSVMNNSRYNNDNDFNNIINDDTIDNIFDNNDKYMFDNMNTKPNNVEQHYVITSSSISEHSIVNNNKSNRLNTHNNNNMNVNVSSHQQKPIPEIPSEESLGLPLTQIPSQAHLSLNSSTSQLLQHVDLSLLHLPPSKLDSHIVKTSSSSTLLTTDTARDLARKEAREMIRKMKEESEFEYKSKHMLDDDLMI